jgi:hypothetical protein
MAEQPKQIRAIDLVKGLFEHIHGNLGLLRFSIEKLEPKNCVPNNPDADKWEVIFSFYKTLSSSQPTRYLAEVNLKDNMVSVNELDIKGQPSEPKKTYQIVENKEEGN